jgi:predicted DNA-binding transcriptional regulator AlpA
MQDIDDALIARFLGQQFAGRRFLTFHEIQSLGLVDNRQTLRTWIEQGAFPAPLKLAGPHGKSTRWLVGEIVAVIMQRLAERDGKLDEGEAIEVEPGEVEATGDIIDAEIEEVKGPPVEGGPSHVAG